MKVLLLKDVPKIGQKGQFVEVSTGYANNYLLKLGLATPATQAIINKVNTEKRDQYSKRNRAQENAQRYKLQLEKRTFIIRVRAGDKGQVFGGVHEKEIIQAIFQKTKIKLEKQQIQIPSPIKQLGEHNVSIKLANEITAKPIIKLESL